MSMPWCKYCRGHISFEEDEPGSGRRYAVDFDTNELHLCPKWKKTCYFCGAGIWWSRERDTFIDESREAHPCVQ